MKRIYPLTFLVLFSCSQSKQDKAHQLVKHFLDSTLNDPGSYESISFTPLYKMKDTVYITNGKPDTVKYLGWNTIGHSFRAKNKFNALVKETQWFMIDSTFTKVETVSHELESKVIYK